MQVLCQTESEEQIRRGGPHATRCRTRYGLAIRKLVKQEGPKQERAVIDCPSFADVLGEKEKLLESFHERLQIEFGATLAQSLLTPVGLSHDSEILRDAWSREIQVVGYHLR
jgi:hypothetical protein